ncbi:hypothetical protein RHMOL_Rhmol10G0195200 [Rhododendron molle]|uniref:Uncharacterized protein n=1 Tax=Rhododendron molle TaxID=49168 RepID=A0ACC0M4B2_RHOML|nr:hypothetical protein RHMOL_Rhmol10G0195200 [Rhododendron molle]
MTLAGLFYTPASLFSCARPIVNARAPFYASWHQISLWGTCLPLINLTIFPRTIM